MLPTFVIGLREGLEAALIVGIIAAFLRKQGRADLLRRVFAGVALAVLLCVGVGVTLRVISRDLPQKQQEGLETVVGALAVVLVTYMVVWMRRHSRELKGQLEHAAAGALGAGGGGTAMVGMAFLAVLREGFETVVFLLAAFNESRSGAAAPAGAVLGLAVALALGYGIYRGGVRINLSRFFRATGLVLVLIAGGLVMSALHTAHEAGWLDAGQGSTVDLSGLVRPGSVQSSLLTGMLGVQPHPSVGEVVGWLLYVVPVGCYVAWPPVRAGLTRAVSAAAAVGVAASAAVVAIAPGGTTSDEGDEAGGPSGVAARQVAVTVTNDHGCLPSTTSLAAGTVTFEVVNKDATGVTEVEVLAGSRIVGEKENLPPGFAGSFAVTLTAGEYELYCPGARVERRLLSVTGTAAPARDPGLAALLATGTSGYGRYVDEQVDELRTAVDRLAVALRGNDLVAAQAAYIAARPYYEKIEPVAESFAVGGDSIDADIDARANDVPGAQWRGFHRIEKGLFTDRSLTGLAPYGVQLADDVRRLSQLVAKNSYQASELANGAQELLDEVAASKITGEEERYSRIDLLDIAFNVEGSEQAFGQLQPALARVDGALADEISARFRALDGLLDRYRSKADPSGFVRYGALATADKRALAAAVKAVQEPLSLVANKIANA